MIDLDTLQKEEPYPAPDGYFDRFPQQVMRQIRKEKARRRNLRLAAAAAALALVLCGATVFGYMQREDVRRQDLIQAEDHDTQLEEQMIDYYSTELAQMDYMNF